MSDNEDIDTGPNSTTPTIEYTENDIARILIATDNHVGFMERDPIRGYDSFAAFEEILAVARREQVDCVFLAGDLFHENKPSRYTLWRTMEILRKYVMGPNPVRIQLLSDYNASRVLGSWGSTTALPPNTSSSSSSSSSTKKSSSSSTTTTTLTSTRNPSSKQRGSFATSQRSSNTVTAEDEIGESAPKRTTKASVMNDTTKNTPTTTDDHTLDDPALQNPLAFALGHGGLFHRVNFEDPHYNIDLPIFCIHGNHDDPSREGPTGDILAALDMLSVANLVNYFGKSESADTIEVTPILLAKGQTRIALYGLGNLRDDRLHRVLLADKVRFRRPAQNPDDWFNILLFHQNRENRSIRGRMGNMGIESILPSFLDLVIWGHEHECKLDMAIAQGRTGNGVERATRILQPGSSVATSLSDGEAIRKHAILLEVRGSQFRRTPIPLRCVRPFRIEEVSLSSAGMNPDAATVDDEVTSYLQGRVDAALQGLQNELNQLPATEVPPPALRLPLVRIKVEHSGFRVLSNQRFGASFVGKVANPADILLFYRKPGTSRTRTSVPLPPAGLLRSIAPADLQSLKVEDLIIEQLASNREAGRGLFIVPQNRLVDAMGKYITGDVGAIRDTVEETIINRKSETSKHSDVARPETLVDMDRKAIQALVTKVNREITLKEESDLEQKPEEKRRREVELERLRTQAALQTDQDSDQRSHDQDEDDEERTVASATTNGRGGAKSRSISAVSTARGNSRKRKASVSEEDGDDNQGERSSEESTGAARGRASSTGRGRRGRGTASTTNTTTSTRGRGKARGGRNAEDEDEIEEEEEAYRDEEDEDDDEEEEEYSGSKGRGGGSKSSSRTTTKPAPKRSRAGVSTEKSSTKKKSSDDPEDTEEETAPSPRRGPSSNTTTTTTNALPPPPSRISGSVFGGNNNPSSVSASVDRGRSASTARALPFAMNRK